MTTTATGVNLVDNPGFETGDTTDWTIGGTPTAQSAVNIGVDTNSDDVNSGTYGLFAGNAYTTTLSQEIDTTPGDQYVVSFYLDVYQADATTGTFTASLGDQQPFALVDATETDNDADPFTKYTMTITADASSSLLDFSFYNPPGFFGLDDISVERLPTQDVFQQGSATETGPLAGAYLWSDSANWSVAVPGDGDSATVALPGVDDIGALHLAGLTLTDGGQINVTGSVFTIDNLVASGNVSLFAGSSIAGASTEPVFVEVSTLTGSGGDYGAIGAGSTFYDFSPTDPGETYTAEDGGIVGLLYAPSDSSTLQYGGTSPGTIALAEFEATSSTSAVAIADVANGDVLELPGAAVDDVSFGAESLTVTTDAGTYTFTDVDYLFTPTSYLAFDDDATGLVAVEISCYGRGTRILTEGGEVAIEALAVGDMVVTASGHRRPVRWLGHRRIDIARHPEPESVWPIVVRAGAFAETSPARDLWLSPGHNVLIGDNLVPIDALRNELTVAQMRCHSVEYWHVELDAHDVILAEGLAAESYLDTGNRAAFADGGVVTELHPTFGPKEWAETCRPLVVDGPIVTKTNEFLCARAVALGFVGGPYDPPIRSIAAPHAASFCSTAS